MSQLNTEEAIQFIQDLSQKSGLESETLVSEGKSFSVSFKSQKIDKYQLSNKKQLGVRVIQNGSEGTSYTESFSKEDLEICFKSAKQNSSILKQTYEASLIENESHTDMPELYNEALENIPVEKKLEMAKALEEEALAVDGKIKALPYNGVNYFNSQFFVTNSKGVNKSYKSNGVYAFAWALAQDGEDRAMAGDGSIARDISGINIGEIAKSAAKKSLARLGSDRPETNNYPVVLSKEAAQTFFEQVLNSFSAKALDEKLSLFDGQLGNQIFSSQLNIVDDPFYKKGFQGTPFDSEGSASKKTTLVEKGRLTSFLSNSIFAKKLDMENTANASRSPAGALGVSPSNFIVSPGNSTEAELLSKHKTIIYVTLLKGLAGFNSLSGDFSVESEGFIYRDGERAEPIANFVVSGNALELMKNIEEVGNDPYVFSSSVISPSLLISELSIAGKNH